MSELPQNVYGLVYFDGMVDNGSGKIFKSLSWKILVTPHRNFRIIGRLEWREKKRNNFNHNHREKSL